jgi:hypothetical protein
MASSMRARSVAKRAATVSFFSCGSSFIGYLQADIFGTEQRGFAILHPDFPFFSCVGSTNVSVHANERVVEIFFVVLEWFRVPAST